MELYEHPWVYYRTDAGRMKRFRDKSSFKIDKHMAGAVLRALIVPPVSLAVWFGIASFLVMCYLTAGGG